MQVNCDFTSVSLKLGGTAVPIEVTSLRIINLIIRRDFLLYRKLRPIRHCSFNIKTGGKYNESNIEGWLF